MTPNNTLKEGLEELFSLSPQEQKIFLLSMSTGKSVLTGNFLLQVALLKADKLSVNKRM